MKRREGKFVPRTIDRVVFAVLGLVMLINGFYLAGPYYLDVARSGNDAPLYSLLNSPEMVTTFGTLMFLTGVALAYSAFGKGVYYAKITAYALLAGFLLRLYSLIGVFLTLESWRPPSYVSHAATVLLFGGYYVAVRVNERTPR